MRRLVLGFLLVVVTAGCLSFSPASDTRANTDIRSTPDADTLIESSIQNLESADSYGLRHSTRLSTPSRMTTRTVTGEVNFSEQTASLVAETSTGGRDVETRINVSDSTVYSDGDPVENITSLRQYLADTEGLRVDYYPLDSLEAVADSSNISMTSTTYEGDEAYRVSASDVSSGGRLNSEGINAEIIAVIDAETRLPSEIRYEASDDASEVTETLRLRYGDGGD